MNQPTSPADRQDASGRDVGPSQPGQSGQPGYAGLAFGGRSARGAGMPVVSARIEVPFRTIIRLLLTLAALWFLITIGAVIAQIFGGLIVAAALYPPIRALMQRGFGRGKALLTVIGGFLAVLGILLVFAVPPLIDEAQNLQDDVPDYIEDGLTWLRDNQRWLYDPVIDWGSDFANTDAVISDEPAPNAPGTDTTGAMDNGSPEQEIAVSSAVQADEAIGVASQIGSTIGTIAIVAVLGVYFLIEGERAFAWLTRDLPPPLSSRLRRAVPAVSQIINAYIIRQGLTSLLCGAFTFVVLWSFGVPAALILAILAAFADAVPFIGVAVATVPAAVVALTQGPGTALTVTLLLLAYQVFEVVFIIPRVFKRTLQLSSFGMLVAVLIGWRLLGFGGMFLALPIAAVILRIEQVWLGEDEPDESSGEEMAEAERELAAT